jgi:hypothetical protein
VADALPPDRWTRALAGDIADYVERIVLGTEPRPFDVVESPTGVQHVTYAPPGDVRATLCGRRIGVGWVVVAEHYGDPFQGAATCLSCRIKLHDDAVMREHARHEGENPNGLRRNPYHSLEVPPSDPTRPTP